MQYNVLVKTCERQYIPKTIDNIVRTEPGNLGQMKGPTTKEGIMVTTSNPCFSPNSRTVLSVNVLEIM